MHASAWKYFPTHQTQHAACDFTHGQWLFGQPSNPQVLVLYGVGRYVGSGSEVVALGGQNRAEPVSDVTIDDLLDNPLVLPDNHLFRAAQGPEVYLSGGGQFHVGSPATRDRLTVHHGAGVEVVPASFIAKLPQGLTPHAHVRGVSSSDRTV